MTSENRIVESLDDIFEEPKVECTGKHPPCNCGWRQIAIKMGYTDVKANTIKSNARRREKARLDQLAYTRPQRLKNESQSQDEVSEKIDEVIEMLKRRNTRYVQAPPKPKPKPEAPVGKGGIAL